MPGLRQNLHNMTLENDPTNAARTQSFDQFYDRKRGLDLASGMYELKKRYPGFPSERIQPRQIFHASVHIIQIHAGLSGDL